MHNHIETIEIKNFKSINSFLINNCTRINLFIGRPNVGKSNLLEALSLFSVPYFKMNSNKKITNFLRLENEAEMFFDGNIDKEIEINTNIAKCKISYSSALLSEKSYHNGSVLNSKKLFINLVDLLSKSKIDRKSVV